MVTLKLAGVHQLSDFVYWGYAGNNNEAKTFDLEFSSDGGATYGAPVTVTSAVRANTGQLTLPLGGTFEADTVRITMTDNHRDTPGAAGGDRVGLGEIKFIGTSAPRSLVTPVGSSLDVGTQFYPAGRLIDDIGLASRDISNYMVATSGTGPGATWVTDASLNTRSFLMMP